MIKQNTIEGAGIIYSIQRYSIHDGPGIRTTIFFKGCQLRCPWCANPESQHTEKEIAFISHKCTMCGLCAKKCPKGAISLNKEPRIDRNICDLCGLCVRYCPVECYKIFGEEITPGELLKEIRKDMAFYRNSGGGITVSGGEPTLQLNFILNFLRLCKENGIDTAMESHGYAEKEVYQKLAPYIDHFLMDVKHMNSDIHKEIIGVGNKKILDNIRMLAFELKKEVSLRIPLIPDFNTDDNNINQFIQYAIELKSSRNLKMIHLLPYHGLGISKYISLDFNYSMTDAKPPSKEVLEDIEEKIKLNDLPVIIGG